MFTLVLPDGWLEFEEARLSAALAVIDSDAGATVRCPQLDALRTRAHPINDARFCGMVAEALVAYFSDKDFVYSVGNWTAADFAVYLTDPNGSGDVKPDAMLRFLIGAPSRVPLGGSNKRKKEQDKQKRPLKRPRRITDAGAALSAAIAVIGDIDLGKFVGTEPGGLGSASELIQLSEALTRTSEAVTRSSGNLLGSMSLFTLDTESFAVFKNGGARALFAHIPSSELRTLRLVCKGMRDLVDQCASVESHQMVCTILAGQSAYAQRIAPMFVNAAPASHILSAASAAAAAADVAMLRFLAYTITRKFAVPIGKCFDTVLRQVLGGDTEECAIPLLIRSAARHTSGHPHSDLNSGLMPVFKAYLTYRNRSTTVPTGLAMGAAIDYGIVHVDTPECADALVESVLKTVWATPDDNTDDVVEAILARMTAATMTPHMLRSATRGASPSSVRLLLDAGVPMHEKQRRTALFDAVQSGAVDMVRTLLPDFVHTGMTLEAEERLILKAMTLEDSEARVLNLLMDAGLQCNPTKSFRIFLSGKHAASAQAAVSEAICGSLACSCWSSRRKTCQAKRGLREVSDYSHHYGKSMIVERCLCGAALLSAMPRTARRCKMWDKTIAQVVMYILNRLLELSEETYRVYNMAIDIIADLLESHSCQRFALRLRQKVYAKCMDKLTSDDIPHKEDFDCVETTDYFAHARVLQRIVPAKFPIERVLIDMLAANPKTHTPDRTRMPAVVYVAMRAFLRVPTGKRRNKAVNLAWRLAKLAEHVLSEEVAAGLHMVVLWLQDMYFGDPTQTIGERHFMAHIAKYDEEQRREFVAVIEWDPEELSLKTTFAVDYDFDLNSFAAKFDEEQLTVTGLECGKLNRVLAYTLAVFGAYDDTRHPLTIEASTCLGPSYGPFGPLTRLKEAIAEKLAAASATVRLPTLCPWDFSPDTDKHNVLALRVNGLDLIRQQPSMWMCTWTS